MDFALLIATGLVVGTLGSLVGVGGGFIVVPVLLLVFAYPHLWTVSTSLFFIFINSLVSSYNYSRQKRVDFATGIPFALSTIPGALVGAHLVPHLSGKAFDSAFAMLLLLVSLFMLFKPQGPPKDRTPNWMGKKTTRQFTDAHGIAHEYSFSLPFGVLISFFVGFLSSIFGIGGGIIHVPVMTLIMGIPPHIATATSMFILTISSFAGTVPHLVAGDVQLVASVALSIGAIVGAHIGTRLAPQVNSRRLMQLFSIIMLVLALRLLLR
ncbi:unknown yune-like protein, putative permease [Heliomicrobium modesticaldum Ice1]|uniref:Probable membrane transporter protein n=1 Tax=Heliobacterium modesticaldum (strain ATCC 51547 / Ice1) TaxID=498761 RepID=B0TI22_HELMI|nr:sulfite exporter TauE/SafE family protein [Heliomicrobium modesticaldum]ABZ82695.1 unknown yune-like protein, putative permease [Heliomicrobium modesticaldum Ice1]